MSPSIRREWIEMIDFKVLPKICWSPSIRREWIEMTVSKTIGGFHGKSPSIRREWIEMRSAYVLCRR